MNPSVLYEQITSVPPDEDLANFRNLLVGSQFGKVQVGEAVSNYIQRDFVNDRQRDPNITSDDLIRRMTIAKCVKTTLHYDLVN